MFEAIQQRLKKLLQSSPLAGLNHHIGGHPGLQSAVAQSFQLLIGYSNVHQVERLTGAIIHRRL